MNPSPRLALAAALALGALTPAAPVPKPSTEIPPQLRGRWQSRGKVRVIFTQDTVNLGIDGEAVVESRVISVEGDVIRMQKVYETGGRRRPEGYGPEIRWRYKVSEAGRRLDIRPVEPAATALPLSKAEP